MAQNWYLTFYDEFTDGFVGLHTQTGNGEITESAGQLHLKTLGADCRWWSDGQSAPVAYMIYPDVEDRHLGLWMAEAKLPAFTYSGNTCLVGLVAWQDRDNAAWVGWYPSDSKMYVQQGVNDSWSTLYTSAAVVAPSTLAHHYRIFWNHSDHALTVMGGQQTLGPNRASFWYSVDGSGAVWNHAYTYSTTPSFTPLRYGMFLRNWSPYPTAQADFEFLKLSLDLETDVTQQRRTEESAGSTATATPLDQSSTEPARSYYPQVRRGAWPGWDAMVLEDWGDPESDLQRGSPELAAGSTDSLAPADDSSTVPARFGLPQTRTGAYYGASRGIPARASLTENTGAAGSDDMVEREVAAGATDSLIVINTSGEPRFLEPQVGRGLASDARELGAGASDFGAFHFVPASYGPWNDEDARLLIGRVGIRSMEFVRTDLLSPFGTMVGNWYAGRDGTLRALGVPCAPGALTNGAGTEANLGMFRWSDRDPGGASNMPAPITILGYDSIRMAWNDIGPTSAWADVCYVESRYKWFLDSDFDIAVDVSNYLKNTGSGTELECRLEVIARSSNTYSARIMQSFRSSGSRNWRRDTNNNGSLTNVWESSGGGTAAFALRIERSGTTLRFYYDSGGGWVQMGGDVTTSGNIGTSPVIAKLMLGGYNHCDGQVDWSNFRVLSGSWTNKVSWYREAAGTYRGSRQDMPEYLLMTGTKDGLDMIDVANGKLWARVKVGSNNVLWSGGDGKQQVMAIRLSRLGILNVAFGSRGGTTGGFVQLNMAQAHISRYYGTTGGDGYYSNRLIAEECWPERNNGRSYYAGTNPPLPANSCLDAEQYAPTIVAGDPVWTFVATTAGLRVTRGRQWCGLSNPLYYADADVLAEVLQLEVDHSNGDLYFLTATNVYRVTKTTYDAALGTSGGSFSPDNVAAVPGRVWLDIGRAMAVVGSAVFVATREGVYQINWGGAATLRFGTTGSGATAELFPPMTLPVSLGVRSHGGGDQLLVLLDHLPNRPKPYPTDVSWRNVLVINLTDNSVAHQRVFPGRGILVAHDLTGAEP